MGGGGNFFVLKTQTQAWSALFINSSHVLIINIMNVHIGDKSALLKAHTNANLCNGNRIDGLEFEEKKEPKHDFLNADTTSVS